MKNAYPEKPVLPYQKTSVSMNDVIAYIQSVDTPVEVKRAAYCFFRFESANGTKGLNNNYAGIQADGVRWPAIYDDTIAGTVIKKENGPSGKDRIFIAFNNWHDSLNFTISNTTRRGLFIGGKTFLITQMEVLTPTDLCIAYKREWVTGSAAYNPADTEIASFVNTYNKGAGIFVAPN
ncbi:hypothetical protein CLV51_103390 [Chitinophaga niastensis]|uniref:Uncharacterized protein n=1 Tax=Chitinophaga niastensis TaxID=536980 RepID=A0A2P8HJL1_CHINA|nr:hypothetical protein [Chitinophaga niastensis]PSL46412.1 hypothetical protein CLV51_103390 [Chitinophaga niastensis]